MHRTRISPVGGTRRWRTECDTCGTVLKVHPSRLRAMRHAIVHRLWQ